MSVQRHRSSRAAALGVHRLDEDAKTGQQRAMHGRELVAHVLQQCEVHTAEVLLPRVPRQLLLRHLWQAGMRAAPWGLQWGYTWGCIPSEVVSAR